MSTVVDRSVSTLNPNAPAFDLVGFREVEDFSPKWWELVTTSKWFRDFWLSANSEEYEFGEFSDMEDEFEELIVTSSGENEMDGSSVRGNEKKKHLRCLEDYITRLVSYKYLSGRIRCWEVLEGASKHGEVYEREALQI